MTPVYLPLSLPPTPGLGREGSPCLRAQEERPARKGSTPDWGCGVLQLPPGLGWVQVAAPQLPVEALGGQWVLFYLKVVIFDVIERRRDDPFPVFLDAREDWLRPEQEGRGEQLLLPRWAAARRAAHHGHLPTARGRNRCSPKIERSGFCIPRS